MANDFNEDEILNIIEDITDSLRRGIPPNVELVKQLGAASGSSSKLVKGLGEAATSAAKNVTALGGQIGRGNTSFTAFNNIVDSAANGIAKLAGNIPILGSVVKGTADAFQYAAEQFQTFYGSFEKLSDVGIIGADGIGQLSEAVRRAGVPIQTFESIVLNNSKALAAMDGTAVSVTKQFTGLLHVVRNQAINGQTVDNQLRNLGYSTQDMSEVFVDYADMQRKLGNQQFLDQGRLTRGTIEYAKELDIIAKVTGQSRKESEKVRDAAMAESRWRATLSDMAPEQAKQLTHLTQSLTAFSPEMARGMRDMASGFVQSADAQKLWRTTGGAAFDIIEQVKSGMITYDQALIQMQDATKANFGTMKGLAKATGDATGVYANFPDVANFVTASLDDFAKALSEQTKQVSGYNKITQNLTDAARSMEETAGNIQSLFVSSGLAAKGVNLLASAMEAGVKKIMSVIDEFGGTTEKSYSVTETAEKARLRTLREERTKKEQELAYWERQPTVAGPRIPRIQGELADLNQNIDELSKIVAAQPKAQLVTFRDIMKKYVGRKSTTDVFGYNTGLSTLYETGAFGYGRPTKTFTMQQQQEIQAILDANKEKLSTSAIRNIREIVTAPVSRVPTAASLEAPGAPGTAAETTNNKMLELQEESNKLSKRQVDALEDLVGRRGSPIKHD